MALINKDNIDTLVEYQKINNHNTQNVWRYHWQISQQ